MRDASPPAAAPAIDSTGGRGMSVLNAMYYAFKPFLPQAARYTMRRLRMNFILLRTDEWPILPSAATKPPGWPGWPGNKEFCLLLTHDVEGQAGLDRCLRLAEMEASHGFRSSFNLIPEGGYIVPTELRRSLDDMGFEIGVHDLRHDGSLYRSRRSFDECAVRINTYLREWRAVGFRAGFMFHNLEWIKTLDVEYDASTFDTDPFEPQPDGVGTIFPFLVEDDDPRRSYVEIPYTLPQDATLFLVLRERDIDIWLRKTAWLADHGGLVHVNVHPDYLRFDGKRPAVSEFDAGLYEEFLLHLKEHYAGRYWNPLPRELGRYVATGSYSPAPDSRQP